VTCEAKGPSRCRPPAGLRQLNMPRSGRIFIHCRARVECPHLPPGVRATPAEGGTVPVRIGLQRRVSSTSSRVSCDSSPGSGHQLRGLLAPVRSAVRTCSRRYPPDVVPMTVPAKTGARAGWSDLGNEPLRSRSQFRAVLLRATHRRISVRHDVYHMRCGGAPR